MRADRVSPVRLSFCFLQEGGAVGLVSVTERGRFNSSIIIKSAQHPIESNGGSMVAERSMVRRSNVVRSVPDSSE